MFKKKKLFRGMWIVLSVIIILSMVVLTLGPSFI